MFRRTCGDYTRVLSTLAHEAAGAAKHPAFPAPSSLIERDTLVATTRALLRRGNANACGHGFVIPKMTVGLFDIQIRTLARDGARRHGPV
jgi:hypothetical protein